MIYNPIPVIKSRRFGVLPAGNYGEGAVIASAPLSFPANTTGQIEFSMPFIWSGVDVAGVELTITTPANFEIPDGALFDSRIIHPYAINGLIAVTLPFWCSGVVNGNITLTHTSAVGGSILTVGDDAYYGGVRYGQ